jgi:signal transduction histidine kinase
LRGRVALVGGVGIVVGYVLYQFTWTFVRNTVLSLFWISQRCPNMIRGYGEVPCVVYSGPTRWLAAIGLLVALVVLGYVLYRAAGFALRPIEDMRDTVRQMGPQNLGHRVPVTGRDELADLATALNAMLDRVATGYEGQRRFASNASHELRTPLAVQRTLVEVALVTGEQDLPRLAAQLLTVNERNEQLIEGLLVLAESDRGLPGTSPVRFDELVGEVLARFAEQAEKHSVTVRPGLMERVVHGDPLLLERMVSNLVHNAIKYNEPGGFVDVVVAHSPALAIHNSGQKIPAETVPALFEPFRRLTADRTYQRDGAGLGLSIVRSIARAHGGSTTATPGDKGGLKVTVSLP